MHRGTLAVLGLLLGCDSGGTEVQTDEGGTDATTDATTETASAPDSGASETGADSLAPSPCVDLDATLRAPSVDCLYGGHCPVGCAGGTASAYACDPGPGGVATYPAAFDPPSDLVDLIAYVPDAYPWEAGAYLSCAPLGCTRWSTADHVDGGSAWPGDPCAAGGAAAHVWACPTTPGILPSPAGCFNAGDRQRIGGADTGIPVNVLWCCP